MKLIVGLLLASLLAAAYVMGSGAYNMAATEKHWTITEKMIEWVRVNSISARSKDLEIPVMSASSDFDYVTIGAMHYDAMCTACHLAPGQATTELAQGLYPQAPVFHQRIPPTSQEDSQEQIKAYFWVIKNGIKMTAMPAWGITHDNNVIWAMAFFVQDLAGMSTDRYHELTSKNGGSSTAEHDDHMHHHDKAPFE
ncbi:c-type cytochrome [Nitrosomonas aestuarii]|uniref:c-type cytochrome n=1 Tax=Nitrosomonas aestuarii TaxID=52441 RepID=UPI000D313358|nr:cytochrome c [Nitrosomonas aestuarii]PTN13074.1 cbb3-type cytochrome c oxidase subunit III [Nitrosomonas aestuarii]